MITLHTKAIWLIIYESLLQDWKRCGLGIENVGKDCFFLSGFCEDPQGFFFFFWESWHLLRGTTIVYIDPGIINAHAN